jgi:hypothetical protein
LHGRRTGPPGTPVAFETVFGWVLAGLTNQLSPEACATSHHSRYHWRRFTPEFLGDRGECQTWVLPITTRKICRAALWRQPSSCSW